MKKLTKSLYFNVALFMLAGIVLAGCAGNRDEESTAVSSKNSSSLKSTEEATSKPDGSSPTSEPKQSDKADKADKADGSSDKAVDYNSGSTSSENSNSNVISRKDKETLSDYSSNQIEYARIWLQLGPNQEIDELNVRHISAGEPVNIYDNTSANYPKDVVTLEGSRSVDGSVTYSSNGNGTINVYNVPSHWSSSAQVDKNFMKNYTEDIIRNAKLVHVDPGEDKKIIELINILKVH
ncbi:MAG: hypothetical protein WBA30_03045 [Priestia megaterium]|uniref:hypothetical protein n=1 Tax=Priestia megaterium TaxID=1404 RepID=UPI000680BE08|nr:hypothetical protein [Priestia megaterium]KNH20259.1 hypothetical protein ACS78_17885 [Priestia megaterium]